MGAVAQVVQRGAAEGGRGRGAGGAGYGGDGCGVCFGKEEQGSGRMEEAEAGFSWIYPPSPMADEAGWVRPRSMVKSWRWVRAWCRRGQGWHGGSRRGWSGVVYSARMPSTGTLIAVKRFRACDEVGAAAFASKIGALARVHHQNIVQLLGWAANCRTRLLFYDYLLNETLGALLHGSRGPTVEWEVRLGIAMGWWMRMREEGWRGWGVTFRDF